MTWASGAFTLPAGYATPVVSNSALGMSWSFSTWSDVEAAFNGIITAQSADASPDPAADYLLEYDASAGQYKKVLINTLVSAGSLVGINRVLQADLSIAANYSLVVSGYFDLNGHHLTLAAGADLHIC